MRIALAQINYHIGNFEENILKVKDAINKAKEGKADLLVFAELAISGYPPRDFLNYKHFVEQCISSIQNIAAECTDVAVIIGSPSFNPNKKGKPLFNTAFFLADGKIKSLHHKTLLPNYDVFDEYRYFEPNKECNIVEYKGAKFAVTICEDLWNLTDSPLYTSNPMDTLIKQKPDFIINIAASPFNYNQSDIRKAIYSDNAKHYKLPLFYVNHIGAQTELLFDGGSMCINSNGEIVDELKYFEEDFKIFDIDKVISANQSNQLNQRSIFDKSEIINHKSKIKLIHDALIMGINDYFKKSGFKKAIIGLSGGIDSAVTLVLATRALGKENVKAVLMPSMFSSKHSIDDSVQLADVLGVSYDIISIEEGFDSLDSTLKPYFKDLPFDIAEENMQARIRAVILMALSNKFAYILLNTSNKSEAAVGYGTLYGDMCGGFSVLGDIYKTQVYELAEYINKTSLPIWGGVRGGVISDNIINKPPSAELGPEQKDSDSLPEYTLLDKILFQYIEESKGLKEIIEMGFDEALVKKVLKLVNNSEWKRYQTPPILEVSPKAFGMGRRMPIVAKYLS